MFAQWAVNVVAYRDHNGIMIPFPYDLNPFGTRTKARLEPRQYAAAHRLGLQAARVADHRDLGLPRRRTQDLNDETVDSNKGKYYPNMTWSRTAAGLTTDTTASKKNDPGFNQGFRPQGSLFIEFFNPWPKMEPRTPDLGTGQFGQRRGSRAYQDDARGGQPARLADLATGDRRSVEAIAEHPPTGQHCRGRTELPDPDNPNLALRPTIERTAYFVRFDGSRPIPPTAR